MCWWIYWECALSNCAFVPHAMRMIHWLINKLANLQCGDGTEWWWSLHDIQNSQVHLLVLSWDSQSAAGGSCHVVSDLPFPSLVAHVEPASDLFRIFVDLGLSQGTLLWLSIFNFEKQCSLSLLCLILYNCLWKLNDPFHIWRIMRAPEVTTNKLIKWAVYSCAQEKNVNYKRERYK